MLLPEVGYHDDFCKVPINLAHFYDPEPLTHSFHDLSPFLPYTSMPGYDTPYSIIRTFKIVTPAN
jgi:hypothetical protein